MWTRKQVKERGKKSFKKNYWKAIIVAILLSIVAGGAYNGFSGGSGAASQGFQQGYSKNGDGSYLIGETSDGADLTMDVDKDVNGNVNVTFDAKDKNGNSIEDANGKNEAVNVSLDEGESKGFWVVMALTFLVVMTTVTAIVLLLDAFIVNPIEMGCNKFFLRNLDEEAEISNVSYAFDHSYKNVVGVMFRRDIAIALWSMLFVIPGIIKSYEYRMIPYLLAEHPEMSWKDAFAESKEMMAGNKWKAFVLDFSFIGWQLLSILTLGLLSIFYVNPYKFSTNAALYEAIKYGTPTDYEVAEA